MAAEIDRLEDMVEHLKIHKLKFDKVRRENDKLVAEMQRLQEENVALHAQDASLAAYKTLVESYDDIRVIADSSDDMGRRTASPERQSQSRIAALDTQVEELTRRAQEAEERAATLADREAEAKVRQDRLEGLLQARDAQIQEMELHTAEFKFLQRQLCAERELRQRSEQELQSLQATCCDEDTVDARTALLEAEFGVQEVNVRQDLTALQAMQASRDELKAELAAANALNQELRRQVEKLEEDAVQVEDLTLELDWCDKLQNMEQKNKALKQRAVHV